MIGAIIGDIIGSKYEFHNIRTKEFPMLSPDCDYTDDSLMTIAVAGATVNMAVPMTTFLSLSIGIPISLPRRHALTRKYTDCARTTATIIPASRNSTGLLTLNSKSFPSFL